MMLFEETLECSRPRLLRKIKRKRKKEKKREIKQSSKWDLIKPDVIEGHKEGHEKERERSHELDWIPLAYGTSWLTSRR
jgi:hypothetical protein